MQTAHSSIELEQEKVIEEFSQFTDWSDKYEYLIDLGKALPALDEKYKTEFHLVKGCQSQVWLHAFVKENKLYLVADSDTVITKGLIALLIRVLNGQDILDIENADLTFIEQTG